MTDSDAQECTGAHTTNVVERDGGGPAEYPNPVVASFIGACVYGLALGFAVSMAGGPPQAAALATVSGVAIAAAGVVLS